MVRKAWIVVALTFACCGLISGEARAQFGSLFARKASVAEIKVDQLRSLQLDEANQGSAPPFVLVDVRNPDESAVSVIPGAITKSEFEQNLDRYRNRTVITYCTSGYRSGKYAQQLASQGIKTRNFKGSILGWCAAGLPLVTSDGEATNRVHTYSSRNRVPSKYKAVW